MCVYERVREFTLCCFTRNFQADLGQMFTIRAIATRARGSDPDQWTTKYQVKYSEDDIVWIPYLTTSADVQVIQIYKQHFHFCSLFSSVYEY